MRIKESQMPPETDSHIQTSISDFEKSIKVRHNKNLFFFKENMTTIFKKITHSKRMAQITFDPTSKKIELLKNNTPVYYPSSLEFAIQETQSFINSVNERPYIPKFGFKYLPHLIDKSAFSATAKFYDQVIMNSKPRENINYDLVIFGCGLGYHIEILVNVHRFRNITIIENDIAKFKATLFTIDWQGILTSLPSNRRITFIINENRDDQLCTDDFHKEIKLECINLFPSTTLATLRYIHKPDEKEHIEAKSIMRDHSNHFQVLFEKIGPDGQRLLNANENLRIHNKIMNLKDSKIKTAKKIAIIGAGPSLDEIIHILKQFRDHFFIISSGSSLSSLLGHGINPDLHIELEYKILLKNLIEHIRCKFSLENIPIIATLETHPHITKYFKDCHHFIPETSEVSSFINKNSILQMGGVNCVVAATAIANNIFETDKEFYFFGIDFANLKERHHSKTNISMDDNLPKHLEKLKITQEIIKNKYNIDIESVYGEKLKTSQALNSSRIAMNDLTKNIKRNMINLSSGAKITNTQHMEIDNFKVKLIDCQHIKKTNDCFYFNIVEYDYNNINNHCKKLAYNALETSNEIQKFIQKEKNSEYEKLIQNIHNVDEKIRSINSLHLKRITYSINRLPLFLLYQVCNFANTENLPKVLDIWLKDYQSYLDTIKTKFISLLKNKKTHLLNEEWTDLDI